MLIERAVMRIRRSYGFRSVPLAKYRCAVCGWQWWDPDWIGEAFCWRCAEWEARPEIKKIAVVAEDIAWKTTA